LSEAYTGIVIWAGLVFLPEGVGNVLFDAVQDPSRLEEARATIQPGNAVDRRQEDLGGNAQTKRSASGLMGRRADAHSLERNSAVEEMAV